MIYCPNCGTANQKGSRFCSECGESLPSTGLRCPMCGAINSISDVFCEECAARLVPVSPPSDEGEEPAQPSPIKGLILPTIPLGEEGKEQDEALASGGQESTSSGDWLDDLRSSAREEAYLEPGDVSDTEGDQAYEEDAEPLEPVDIPDWLTNKGPIGQTPEPSPGGDVALPREASAEEPAPQDAAPAEPPLEAADIPDWLREFAPSGLDSQDEEVPDLEDDELLEPPEFPDWLRDLGPVMEKTPSPPSEEPATIEGISPSAAAEPAMEHRPPEGRRTGEQAEETDRGGESGEEEVPRWFQETVSAPAQPEKALEPDETETEEPISATIEMPDWLKESVEAGTEAAPLERAPEQELLSIDQPLPEEAAEAEEVPPETALESVEISAGLHEEVKAGADAIREDSTSPFTEDPSLEPETPAWLTELLAEEPSARDEPALPAVKAPFDEDEIGIELERAEIPEWLLELQRDQSRDQEIVEGPVETEGLLQGLRGLLPSSSVIETPSPYKGLSTVVPSEASLARAELLQNLLSQPVTRAKPGAQGRKARIGVSVWRRPVAAVLLVVVLTMLLAPLVASEAPQLTQPVVSSGTLRLYDTIDELAADDDVLVAFDYGPAEADELNAVAHPILQHIIDQGVDVSIVSTRPVGPLVASALMDEIAGSREQYRILSYRPGAATAVSQWLATAGQPPALLVILTSRAGPLRRWVEQARAHYGDQLPVTLVGSAALEPAAIPYLEVGAGQLRGAIHGLNGGAAYEYRRETNGAATRRLDALAAAHIAVVGLMIVFAAYCGLDRAFREKT